MLQAFRLLLFPVSLLYGLIVYCRNYFYHKQWFKSAGYNLPVISIGNLAVGGAGKSPMAEYIIRLLKHKYRLAVLSRGYGRKTTGFMLVNAQCAAADVGDEPLQFKHKFPDITVAVCENRNTGINTLKTDNEIIILDDAYQHRAVKPGLNILLFDYTALFKPQWLLPTGNLREPLSERKRANMIVVSKTPDQLTESETIRITRQINPLPGQELFFSYLEYGNLTAVYTSSELPFAALTAAHTVLLLTGIANAKPLINKLQQITNHIIHHQYADHYTYSTKNIAKLAACFAEIQNADKLIITTEKDAQRLRLHKLQELLKGLPVYYLPVAARIHTTGEARFNQVIEDYVTQRY